MANDMVTGSDGLGGRPGERWRNLTDDTWYQLVSSLRKPCAVCLRRHGRISPRPWPLPFHPHCLLPGTTIIPSGVLAAFRTRYEGNAVRLTIADGSTFAVTANHMLLTPTGFAPASALVPGDDVIDCGIGQGKLRGHPDDDRQPTPIDQVVESLAMSRGVMTRSVPVAPEHLHGDGRSCQCHVDVIGTDRLLRGRLDSEGPEVRGEKVLYRSSDASVSLPAPGDLEPVLAALRDATDGGVGRLRERKALLWAQLRRADQSRGAASSGRHPMLRQDFADQVPRAARGPGDRLLAFAGLVTPEDVRLRDSEPAKSTHPATAIASVDPGGLQLSDDRPQRDAVRIRDALGGLSGLVTTRRVLDVNPFHHSGPIYDVQTTSTLYAVGTGIVSSNCQCEQLEIPAGAEAPIEFRSAGGLAEAMPVGGQVELVGALNWLIRSARLVSWEDLFDGNGDPRDFEDVVRRKGLTVEQLRRAGVAEGVARRAVGLGPMGK